MAIPKTIQDKLNEGRQYRELASIATTDDQIVEGYCTTYDQDYELYRFDTGLWTYIVNERVDSHAFDETDMSDVIMQYNHEGRVFARKSNNTLELESDEHGMKIRANLGGTEIGRQLYEEIQGGYTTKMSFGFTVSKDKTEEIEDQENHTITVNRTILGIGKLYDVSAVSLPANNATEISARSYCEGVIQELEEERLKREKIERQKQKIRIMLEIGG